jgi:tetratricopeptide (TPR) repeat protein
MGCCASREPIPNGRASNAKVSGT